MKTRWSMKKTGFGSLADDITAAFKIPTDPLAILAQFWGVVQGRSWNAAFDAANARAAAKRWTANDRASLDDFVTLCVSSAVSAKKWKNYPASSLLVQSGDLIAKRAKVKKLTPGDIQRMSSGATGAAELPLLYVVIIAAIMEAVIIVAVFATLAYFGSTVIDDVLSKIECDRELVRLHAEYNKILANKQSGSQFTDDEKKVASDLVEQIKFVENNCTKTKPPLDPWPYVLGLGVAATAVLGVVYMDEIKSLFKKHV